MNESQNRSSHILSSSSRFTDVEEAYIVGHLHVSDVLNEFLKRISPTSPSCWGLKYYFYLTGEEAGKQSG